MQARHQDVHPLAEAMLQKAMGEDASVPDMPYVPEGHHP